MKILFVATVVKTHIMEFHIPYLKMLKDMGWETAVASRNDYDDPSECVIPYCDTYYNVPFERNPFKFGNIKAYSQLKKIIDEGCYDIIHCHTPVGAMLTRLAAVHARKHGCKVIYTAHGFHFYKGAPILNWLVYYPVEKILAKKTDVIITINKEDYERAKREFNAGRVEYLPGIGVNLKKFRNYSQEHTHAIRGQLGIPTDTKVLLSVGEVNSNKNHSIVIKTLPDFPDVRYVICGSGPLIDKHMRLAEKLGVSDRVVFVGYRTDVVDFYGMADVFVLPSLREGLPVALMEAMAAGIICVASRNRGTADLLSHSSLLFDATDPEDLKEKLSMALIDDCRAEIERNINLLSNYDLAISLDKMRTIYSEVISAAENYTEMLLNEQNIKFN